MRPAAASSKPGLLPSPGLKRSLQTEQSSAHGQTSEKDILAAISTAIEALHVHCRMLSEAS